jgi:hypothetical protein
VIDQRFDESRLVEIQERITWRSGCGRGLLRLRVLRQIGGYDAAGDGPLQEVTPPKILILHMRLPVSGL